MATSRPHFSCFVSGILYSPISSIASCPIVSIRHEAIQVALVPSISFLPFAKGWVQQSDLLGENLLALLDLFETRQAVLDGTVILNPRLLLFHLALQSCSENSPCQLLITGRGVPEVLPSVSTQSISYPEAAPAVAAAAAGPATGRPHVRVWGWCAFFACLQAS